MELRCDLWHLAFANLVDHRGPPNFDVLSEVRLSIEPQRADLMLLRRLGAAREDDKAQVLRALWPRLGLVTILEYKSPVDSSFRPGDLVRLWSYGGVYHSAHYKELPTRGDLTLALVVPSITPTLRDEIAAMGWKRVALGGGYSRIDGAVYAIHVVVTDEVSTAENDEFLEMFSHHRAKQGAATIWLQNWLTERNMKQQDVADMPGYSEMFQKLVEAMPIEKRLAGLSAEEVLATYGPEQRLSGLAPEQRLSGLAPEQRLSGLDRDHQALALPVEVLRALSEAYIRSLAPEIQEEIRRRLQRESH